MPFHFIILVFINKNDIIEISHEKDARSSNAMKLVYNIGLHVITLCRVVMNKTKYQNTCDLEITMNKMGNEILEKDNAITYQSCAWHPTIHQHEMRI